MALIKGSFYGRVRMTAFQLWRGPSYVVKHGEDPFGGFCLLRLALQQGTATNPRIEARAAYASWADEETSDAILRAMSWESKLEIKKKRDGTPEDAPFTIPAKFVRVPIPQVRQWVKGFNGLYISLQLLPRIEYELPTCSLRIETNSASNAFEMVWPVHADEPSELLRAWKDVWHEMGMALQTHQTVTDVEESFPCVEGKPEVYDLQGYKPLLTLSV